ncbi:RNA polymerase sigma factor (sigma-70 family) [Herbihabitans rhizosphaerae]|uniref:RNA polymerase sigma factor (Sigma-70 family) n=1 Tax=Herbihabitans rhizosphaerae TaxID=1872711 RepID=A0A4Q7KCH3_9PSEU|nr:sigma-70 family RNA polymerase sigma factor [Herbihabitans rhizosphaerae]RZS30325.1 RNA polymerase sigma factor (sigma-70 family) [Herbihabitans rhizosphaerae]
MTETTLVARASGTSRWERAEEHRSRLLRIARRRTVSEQDAEDVVAEALLRAVEHDVDADRLPAWLSTVTVRLCADLRRERHREHRRWSRAAPPAAADSCEPKVCDRAEAAWVAERISDLPARQARALHLRASGLDVAGVARSLEVNYRTAESLLARARSAARAILASALAAIAVLLAKVLRTATAAGHGAVAATSTVAIGTVGVAVAIQPAPPVPVPPAPPPVAVVHGPPAAVPPAPLAPPGHGGAPVRPAVPHSPAPADAGPKPPSAAPKQGDSGARRPGPPAPRQPNAGSQPGRPAPNPGPAGRHPGPGGGQQPGQGKPG